VGERSTHLHVLEVDQQGRGGLFSSPIDPTDVMRDWGWSDDALQFGIRLTF
jgi:hypothetical protein